MYCIGIGEDAHMFEKKSTSKICVIGAVQFKEQMGFSADSDGDVVLHALCNALTCIHHVPILGDKAIKLCRKGQTDSKEYVRLALKELQGQIIDHVSFSIEGLRPRMQSKIYTMRQNVAHLLGVSEKKVGMVCTSGNGLSDYAKGYGVKAICTLISRRQD